jgi:hypothetical protein
VSCLTVFSPSLDLEENKVIVELLSLPQSHYYLKRKENKAVLLHHSASQSFMLVSSCGTGGNVPGNEESRLLHGVLQH